MTAMRELLCPKCGGRMRSYERSEILVEQGEGCRGIFLDHGELERLVDAEGGGWSGRIATPSGSRGDDRDEWRHEDDDRDGRRREPTGSRSTRRESRLGGLFDLFGGD
jgi:Zn-finger nucleic acid-binding protein